MIVDEPRWDVVNALPAIVRRHPPVGTLKRPTETRFATVAAALGGPLKEWLDAPHDTLPVDAPDPVPLDKDAPIYLNDLPGSAFSPEQPGRINLANLNSFEERFRERKKFTTLSD